MPLSNEERLDAKPLARNTGQSGNGIDAASSLAVARHAEGSAPNPQESDFMRCALAALRGRCALVAILGVLFGGAAAAAGWKLGKRLYQSEGLIRVAYTKPVVVRETDQNRPIAMYEAFMRSQQLLMSSRRIVDLALKTNTWRATGRGDAVAVLAEFAENLKVDRPAGTENVRVSYTDEDSTITAAAVNAIIQAYQSDYKAN